MSHDIDDIRIKTEQFNENLKQFTYYLIIFLASLISLFFLPFVGSEIGLEWAIPNTSVGWVVYITTKVIVAGLNVLIFHSFMQQAKVNIKENDKYKKANEILGRIKVKEYHPRSPRQFNRSEYGKRGTTIFISTIGATIALSQALLTFDWMSFLTYLVTIVLGLIFGVMQMFKAEIYWTEEYYDYAKLKLEEINKENEDWRQDISQS